MNKLQLLNNTSKLYASNWPWDPITLYLTEDITFKSHIKPKGFWTSKSGMVKILEDGTIIVKAGYKWDGTSCVPDGSFINDELVPVYSSSPEGVPITWMASLIHDVLYQHLDEIGFPYTRRNCDDIFRVLLESVLFDFSDLYWLGVRLLGGVYRFFGKLKKKFKNKNV